MRGFKFIVLITLRPIRKKKYIKSVYCVSFIVKKYESDLVHWYKQAGAGNRPTSGKLQVNSQTLLFFMTVLSKQNGLTHVYNQSSSHLCLGCP